MRALIPLRGTAQAAHALLLVTLIAHICDELTIARALVAAVLSAPLLLMFPVRARSARASLQRLAVLLVPYVGLLSVEVVANSGATLAANAALLAAALELALVLAIIRRSPARLSVGCE